MKGVYFRLWMTVNSHNAPRPVRFRPSPAYATIIYNYQPTMHVWLDGFYAGEFFVPLDLAEGEIRVKFRTEQRYQTGLDGKVSLVLKTVTYAEVCGEWYGSLP
jgi:hypothetical protein